jgi:phytoene dehydrogenase-like protein
MSYGMAKLKITILGGGIAGVSLALKLADAGFEVEIYEQYNEILSGSSDNTPCRIGIGIHYIDLPTAIKYLQCSINVLKQYPDYVVAHDLDQSHPYRHVVYFVMKDSIFPLDQIKALHEGLRNEYIRLITLDSNWICNSRANT